MKDDKISIFTKDFIKQTMWRKKGKKDFLRMFNTRHRRFYLLARGAVTQSGSSLGGWGGASAPPPKNKKKNGIKVNLFPSSHTS